MSIYLCGFGKSYEGGSTAATNMLPDDIFLEILLLMTMGQTGARMPKMATDHICISTRL